jgi:hypothetical protein
MLGAGTAVVVHRQGSVQAAHQQSPAPAGAGEQLNSGRVFQQHRWLLVVHGQRPDRAIPHADEQGVAVEGERTWDGHARCARQIGHAGAAIGRRHGHPSGPVRDGKMARTACPQAGASGEPDGLDAGGGRVPVRDVNGQLVAIEDGQRAAVEEEDRAAADRYRRVALVPLVGLRCRRADLERRGFG